MKVHKLTAGDGYTYLTRQVAAHDATHRGRSGLGSYYSEKGESPGIWTGRGLGGVPEFPLGNQVTEEQMKALFGEGRHPNARAIERAARRASASPREVDRASMLGRPYHVYEDANEFRRRCAEAFAARNAEDGLPRDWPRPAADRAVIRTRIAREMFAESFGRDPIDPRELSGHVARISRQTTTAVAGYDLTFSPVKSVSTLWAIAPRAISQVIEQAHHDAVTDTLSWIEDHAAYTRRGRNGVAQVDVRGLIAAAFTHRDSRAGDPDLHKHVAVSNKVQALDGTWLALDGRAIYKNNVAASERYNTRLEALLVERLGIRFAEREADERRTGSQHPIREIVGVDGDLPRHWSKRRAAIDVRRAALSAEFQQRHGRPPTTKEAGELGQRATLETRAGKHAPRSFAEQRAVWRTEAIRVLGGEVALRSYLRGALRPDRQQDAATRKPARPTGRWTRRTAAQVLATVQGARAVWQENHIRAEAERRVRAANIRLADVDAAVDAVVARALRPELSLPLNGWEPAGGADAPAALRRLDGASVYTVAGSRLYTSTAVLAAERAILAAAAQRGGRAIDPAKVGLALLESGANGVAPNPGQAQLVRDLATSGARVQLALAPAGTGKTTAMRALSAVWLSSGGNVIGLAPSAAAASTLREELDAKTDTVAKLIKDITDRRPLRFSDARTWLDVPSAEKHTARRAGARWDLVLQAWYAPGGPAQVAPGQPLARWRDWLTTIDRDTLVVIDEAGMVATTDLDRAIAFVLGRGGSVRLIGDDQQLAAIGAGGVLRDLARREGAVTLSQVMRFVHPAGHPQAGAPNHAEGAASLALRDGDPAALAYYLDQRRVHVGDLSTCADDAYDAWRADRAAGHDALMLAPTRDLAAQLNMRARNDRLAEVAATGRSVQLAGGVPCSAGDTIISRRNHRAIAICSTDWVKNGDRWSVDAVLDSGALRVTHLPTRRRITLPAAYVAEHVDLGYACTIHGAQGITADTSHTVATGEESRQLFYVAMTRGRSANHVYLATAGDGDPHAAITRAALLPPTAVDILTRILARDAAPLSATSAAQNLAHPAAALHDAADLYFDALTTAATNTLGSDHLAAIDAAADAAVPHLTEFAAYPALRAHLAVCAAAGADPAALLARAISERHHPDGPHRDLEDARDPAAVLDWRLGFSSATPTQQTSDEPLPWLPAIPDALRTDARWGGYLHAAASDVRDLASAVTADAETWTPTDAPAWARVLVDTDTRLVADLAVWRAATGVAEDDWRPTGEPQLPAAEAHAQRHLNQRIARVLGDPDAAAAVWSPLADSIDPRLANDPYWPILASQLTATHRAGIDVTTLARTVAAEAELPDEQPAAALWWRLARHLSPGATTASGHTANDTLRPDWTTELARMVGQKTTLRITADPGWPGLVAAVTHGAGAGWRPAELLAAAYDLLRGGQPDDSPLRPGELATALTWRISMLADPDPVAQAVAHLRTRDPASQRPSDPVLATASRSADGLGGPAIAWPDATPVLDDDWLASLPEPDPRFDDDATRSPGGADLAARGGLDRARSASGNDHGGVSWVVDGGESAASRGALYEYPAAAAVPRDRIVALNRAAADYYAAAYPDSWASRYVTTRLGDPTRVTVDDRAVTLAAYQLGYAPDAWTDLTEHLHAAGATDTELVAAGLATYASTGRLIDRFRDRLIFPISAASPDGTPEIHGFIARRNPTHDADTGGNRLGVGRHGPKYLNTPETDLFHKGQELFGAVEARDLLAAGATPVLVEGPMDAIAVTLAGGGRYAGVAPMGTALTDAQADQLLVHHPARPQVIVATDADRPGLDAAHRAYWHLVLRGDSPRRLTIDGGGKDPAELLQQHGDRALRDALDAAPSLAGALIGAVLDGRADRLDTVEGRVAALRRSAELIAALPPDEWAAHLSRLVRRTGVPVELAADETFAAHDAWLIDPAGVATRQLARRLPVPVAPTASSRWAALADSINGRLTADASWPALASALDRAASTGYDVAAALPVLAARRPLPSDHPARSLEYRLLDAHPAAIDGARRRRTLGETRAAEKQAAQHLAADYPSTPPTRPAMPRASETAPRRVPSPTSNPESAPSRSRDTTPRR